MLAPSALAGTPEEQLAGELDQILGGEALEGAFAGVHVRSMKDGRALFGRNEQRLFNPASNMKLLTTAAAL